MTNYLITKVEGGYEVVDPVDPGCRFHVTKPNGSMHCTCPDYRNAPKGTCDHIASIIDRFRKPTQAHHPTPAEPIANGPAPKSRPAKNQVVPAETGPAIPELEKGLVDWHSSTPSDPTRSSSRTVSSTSTAPP